MPHPYPYTDLAKELLRSAELPENTAVRLFLHGSLSPGLQPLNILDVPEGKRAEFLSWLVGQCVGSERK